VCVFTIDIIQLPQVMGVSRLITCAAEVPFFHYSQRLIDRVGVNGVLAMACACYVLRFLYYANLTTPWAVLPAELLHGVTFAAMWAARCGLHAYLPWLLYRRAQRTRWIHTRGCLCGGLLVLEYMDVPTCVSYGQRGGWSAGISLRSSTHNLPLCCTEHWFVRDTRVEGLFLLIQVCSAARESIVDCARRW